MSLHDRIILPRSVYEKKKSLPDPSEVNKHIAKGFEILEEDPSVSEFGITKRLDDPTPIAAIPRHDFRILTQYATVHASPVDTQAYHW